MKKSLISTFILLITALILGGCGSKKTTLNVVMKDFSFEPNKYEVPVGGEISLNLTNSGTLDHEFVIINLGEKVTIPFDSDDESKVFWEAELNPGKTETVTFTAPTQPGEYQVVCGTPGHAEQGMVGSLTVK